jgi:hypothetical protein
MMRFKLAFYLCPVCFAASERRERCHDHAMILFDPGNPEDFRRKPLFNRQGQLRSQAPRWFLEGIGWVSRDRKDLV